MSWKTDTYATVTTCYCGVCGTFKTRSIELSDAEWKVHREEFLADHYRTCATFKMAPLASKGNP